MEMDRPVRRTGGKEPVRNNVVQVRFTDAGLAALDQLAKREERTRSDMIRILLRRGMEASP